MIELEDKMRYLLIVLWMLLGSVTSGEGLVRTYEGTGTVVMSPMPYWRQRLFDVIVAGKAAGKS